MTPMVAFGVFGVIAKIQNTGGLNSDIVFTSLTLFELLAAPVALLIETLAGVMSAVGSFQRIGQYLATESRIDMRLTTSHSEEMLGGRFKLHLTIPDEKIRITDMELPLEPEKDIKVMPTMPEMDQKCLVARISRAGWNSHKPPILNDLNFEIKTSRITMIIGPVGCGKSTLLKTMLGEAPFAAGLIEKTFADVAYCSQTPWLTNGTVQRNILGISEMDEEWYNTVISACALDVDIESLQGGDKSMVGSKGVSLSGGQQMRLVCFTPFPLMEVLTFEHRHLPEPYIQEKLSSFLMISSPGWTPPLKKLYLTNCLARVVCSRNRRQQ